MIKHKQQNRIQITKKTDCAYSAAMAVSGYRALAYRADYIKQQWLCISALIR